MVKTLPKFGDKIPAEKLHVSPMNVRFGKPFDPEKNKKDWQLVQNVRAGGIEQSFKVRPEKNPETGKPGYGVYLGRRRYLAEVYLGKKTFTVGDELVVTDASDEEARKASFVEGDEALREEVDPIARAEALQWLVTNNPGGLVTVAAELGMGKGRLSEYLRVLDLDPSMQKQVSEGRLNYTGAVRMARMELPKATQENLAKTLEKEGFPEFEEQLAQHTDKSVKRGPGHPKGKYKIVRVEYDNFFEEDVKDVEKLDMLAKKKYGDKPDARSLAAKWCIHEQLEKANLKN